MSEETFDKEEDGDEEIPENEVVPTKMSYRHRIEELLEKKRYKDLYDIELD